MPRGGVTGGGASSDSRHTCSGADVWPGQCHRNGTSLLPELRGNAKVQAYHLDAMDEGPRSLLALALIAWGSLAVLVTVVLRMTLRDDAGFGAVGKARHRRRAMPPRVGVTPVAIPPRHVARPVLHRP